MAAYRNFRGQRYPTIASQFLMELPREDMEVIEIPTSRYAEPAWEEALPPDDLDFEEPAVQMLDDEIAEAQPSAAASQNGLTTAAALLAEATVGEASGAVKVSPDAFHLGMAVIHPEYGLGKIAALSGSGPKRTATVHFAAGAGVKKFRLAHSPLRPAMKS
jgi:DNA helicase-2/ATP-dependent DNA helicase PcrA